MRRAFASRLRGVLTDENYDCTAVDSGEACLEELARESYEAVLLDIWMPGIDGLPTLSRIQELPAGSRPAVIMISGHGNIETAVKATKLGAFDFVEKPLTIEKVSVVLKNAMQQRRMDLELQRLREDTAAGDHRRQRSDEGSAAAAQADGGYERPRSDLWRERNR